MRDDSISSAPSLPGNKHQLLSIQWHEPFPKFLGQFSEVALWSRELLHYHFPGLPLPAEKPAFYRDVHSSFTDARPLYHPDSSLGKAPETTWYSWLTTHQISFKKQYLVCLHESNLKLKYYITRVDFEKSNFKNFPTLYILQQQL